MIDFILYLIAFLLTAPIVVAFVLYFLTKKTKRHSMIAIHRTVNWTTLLFILSVHFLIKEVFNKNMIGYLIIFLFTILTVIIINQWKKKGEINFKTAYRLLQRISFLIFVLTYILLIIGGITSNYLAS